MLTEVPRGTGRTTRLLKAIPNGGYYVVTHHNLIKYVNQAIDTLGRKQDRLTVVSLDSIKMIFRGHQTQAVGIDHCAVQVMTDEDWRNLIPCVDIIFTNDEFGDVTTTARRIYA